MANKRRRSVGKIDRLPSELRDTVEQMLLNGFYYKDIVAYLQENGVALSQMAVKRFADKYLATVETLKIAQENFRLIADEVEKYPNLDATEILLRISSQHVLNALTNISDDDWEDAEASDIIKNATALVRAASYKHKVDLQSKSKEQAALEANKTLMFEVLARKNPDLYQQVMDALKQE